jgi:hypothetical protein
MIMGRDLISELKLVFDFDNKSITWDDIDLPLKLKGRGVVVTNYTETY